MPKNCSELTYDHPSTPVFGFIRCTDARQTTKKGQIKVELSSFLFIFFKENKRRGLVIYKYLSNAENTAQIVLREKFFLKATWAGWRLSSQN